jgi:DNA mismatch endonuclease (patch repair protein)
VDSLTPIQRRKTMAAVKSVNTKPELLVRSFLHSAGFRYRLHRKDLPGKPDIVLPKYNTVIFVHGCFWHQHTNCRAAARPTTRTEYWDKKLDRNIQRDVSHIEQIEDLGWEVIVVWECETKDVALLENKLQSLMLKRQQ